MKEFPHHDYPLNQIGGIHLNTIEFLSDMHPIRNESEAEDFISRANLIKKFMKEFLLILKTKLMLVFSLLNLFMIMS